MTSVNTKKCLSPMCQHDGEEAHGGFCKDCFDFMLLKFMQLGMNVESGNHLQEKAQPSCSAQNVTSVNTKKCLIAMCKHDGKEVHGGFCKDCSDWMLLKFMQLGTNVEPGLHGGNGNHLQENVTSRNTKKCLSAMCQQDGQEGHDGFCEECFDWVMLKFMPLNAEVEAEGGLHHSDGNHLHIP